MQQSTRGVTMFKGIANLASMLKNAQQMGARMQQLNEQLKAKRAAGTAGGGMVEVELNGLLEVLRCSIDPNVFALGDRSFVEDLVVSAVNAALAKGRQLHVDAMKELTGGLELPGVQEAIAKFSGMEPTDENA
jgi:DNA-binding YbaB/EbfC family protein